MTALALQTQTSDLAADLNAALKPLDLAGRLAAIAAAVPGRIVFTTSFGIEDQAIAHAILSRKLPIDIVTLDTGRMFAETYDVWAETEARYGTTIRAYYPDQSAVEHLVAEQGINGFRHAIDARRNCCDVRKVEPLNRALAGAAAWITGLRGDQSAARAETPFVSVDPARALLKVSPLADRSRDNVVDYVTAFDVPINALHGHGFPSIGCAPCTRAIQPGESERAGRWWWEQDDKKECGLHNNPRRQASLVAVSES